jgi:phosphatidate cytidylyltransferase
VAYANPPAPPKWQDLGIRTASALVLIPTVLLDVWAGGAWFALFAALLGILIAREYVAIVHGGSPVQFALHAAAALAGALLTVEAGATATLLAIAVLSALSLLLAVLAGGRLTIWAVIGVAYVGLPGAALVMLRADTDFGAAAIMFLFATVWAADILAYFAGRTIGGPKLWPKLSPKKTWAGLGGAVTGGVLAGLGVALLYPELSLTWLLAAGAILAVVEQGGDLLESGLKRHYGLKDSGELIPGP